MRTFLIILLLLSVNNAISQSFCQGFNDGYERTINSPRVTPVCPVPDLSKKYDESDYSHGFRTGVSYANADNYSESLKQKTPRGYIAAPSYTPSYVSPNGVVPSYDLSPKQFLIVMLVSFAVMIPLLIIALSSG